MLKNVALFRLQTKQSPFKAQKQHPPFFPKTPKFWIFFYFFALLKITTLRNLSKLPPNRCRNGFIWYTFIAAPGA